MRARRIRRFIDSRFLVAAALAVIVLGAPASAPFDKRERAPELMRASLSGA